MYNSMGVFLIKQRGAEMEMKESWACRPFYRPFIASGLVSFSWSIPSRLGREWWNGAR